MEISQVFMAADRLMQVISEAMCTCDKEVGVREQLAAGSLDLAIEHFESISLLARHEKFGSVHALLRCCVESYAHKFATNDELELFANEKKFQNGQYGPKLSEIRDKMKNSKDLDPASCEYFERYLDHNVKVFHSLTHSGYQQLGRRISDLGIEPSYSTEQVAQVIRHAGTFAAFSAGHAISNWTKDGQVVERFHDLIFRSAGALYPPCHP